MSLRISYQKCQNKEEAFAACQENITEDTLAKFKVSAELEYDDEDYTIKADGSGFNLEAEFDDTGVDVELKLSLIFRPLKTKILGALEREFSKVL